MTRYTHGHQESVLRSHRWRTAENSAGYLLPHLRPDMTLLDVGCGPGTITADLATRVASAHGIDPSASVIADASSAFPDVSFAVGDLFELDGHWDVVHAHQVLQHLADPVAALRKLGELGDLVAVRDSDYTWFQWEPASSALDRWREIYLRVTARNNANADAGRHLLRWAHAAGFTDVTYTCTSWTFATPEDRAWWCGLWADRCLDSSFAQQAVEYGISTTAELSSLAAAWRAWAEDDDAVFVVPSGEILARAG
ncbi:MAG TPA: methyltransferase domain-containing protein [Acidimicrobiales bacterium]|nr:methyltransferase domain-containing protein [Acidimicrobiales bacterium]